MTLLFIWCAMCVLIGVVARNTDRSFAGWFIGAFLFSPLLAGLLLLIVHLANPPQQRPTGMPNGVPTPLPSVQPRNAAEARNWRKLFREASNR
jgi:hypothetical protein